MPLMRSSKARVLYASRVAAIGFPAFLRPGVFPSPEHILPPSGPPKRLPRFHSLASRPLQSPFASTPACSSRSRRAAWVPSLIATSPGASTSREASQSLASFRPQVLSTSRRFTPRSSSAGLFHPAAAQGTLTCSGASLPVQPWLPRRKRVPPCRWRRSLRELSLTGHAPAPRLRGLHPHRAAFRAIR